MTIRRDHYCKMCGADDERPHHDPAAGGEITKLNANGHCQFCSRSLCLAGNRVEALKPADVCTECESRGFSLFDVMGSERVPDGTQEIERCDSCEKYDSDEDAVAGAYAYIMELEQHLESFGFNVAVLRSKKFGYRIEEDKQVRFCE